MHGPLQSPYSYRQVSYSCSLPLLRGEGAQVGAEPPLPNKNNTKERTIQGSLHILQPRNCWMLTCAPEDMKGWMEGRMAGRKGGRKDGWMDGWKEG